MPACRPYFLMCVPGLSAFAESDRRVDEGRTGNRSCTNLCTSKRNDANFGARPPGERNDLTQSYKPGLAGLSSGPDQWLKATRVTPAMYKLNMAKRSNLARVDAPRNSRQTNTPQTAATREFAWP